MGYDPGRLNPEPELLFIPVSPSRESTGSWSSEKVRRGSEAEVGILIGNILCEGEKLEVGLEREIAIYLLVNHMEVTLEAREINLLRKDN